MNIGLNLLRIILTLGVVMDHFWWTPDSASLTGVELALWHLRTLAVPAFMTMTFFFTAKRFTAGDAAWLRKRFGRLLEPFFFWAFACFVAAEIAIACGWNHHVTITDLLWQLGLGHSQNLCLTQFWFHIDLMALTLLVFFARRLLRAFPRLTPLPFILIAVGFSLEYSPAAMDALFGWMPFEAKYPLGRIVTMMPYAGVGLLLASIKDRLDAVSASGRVILALSGLWLAWLAIYRPLCPRPNGIVGYEGLNLALIAWGVMAAFYYIPFDRLPAVFSRTVTGVSKYCMGVYCVHNLFGNICFDCLFRLDRYEPSGLNLAIGPWWFWLFVWISSFMICYLISLIPLKFFKRIVE